MRDRFRPSGRALYLLILLLASAALRLQGIDWDRGQHLHPDERFLTMVATDVRAPGSFGEYFDTARSPLNPASSGRGFFVYGTFPLFLVKGIAAALGLGDYGHVHLVGRVLAALFDIATVALTWHIGLLLAGPGVALAAAALMAFSVTAIQHSHFFTVDSFATFFATAALLALARVAVGAGAAWHLAFGVAFGVTLACRINLVLLGLLYPIALWYAWRYRQIGIRVLALLAVLSSVLAAAVFRVLQPYAFAGPGFFGVTPATDFVQALQTIRALASGEADYPPSVQWIGRRAILFPGWNLLVWGLGPFWGLAALAGVVWVFARRTPAAPGEELGAGRLVLLWVPLLFFFHATQFAATVRYFLPLVPLLAVSAAWWLVGPASRGGRGRRVLVAVVVATALWALAFTTIYRQPHTRVEASRWIYDSVPPSSTVATEHWDDGLPLAIGGESPAAYERIELRLYDEENESKRTHLVESLNAADVLVLSSNRLYGSIPRTPWRYPLARRYYELLFAGELGFRLERVFTSYPALGPIEIPDDRAEEAFTVYDHPKVLIFRKTPEYSEARVASLLNAVSLSNIARMPPREASALYRRTQPTDLRPTEDDGARAAVTKPEPGSVESLTRWLLLLELLSVSTFALLFRPLAAAKDRGYALAKLVAWLGPGTAVWLLASSGVVPQTAAAVRGVMAVVLAAGALAGWRLRAELWTYARGERRSIAAAEAVFLGAFGLFLAVRAFNPAVYWGEKPMDFAILNAALRSVTMPPADPWFAGEPLNYFYFGHAVTAIFTKAAGVPPAMAFNLALATLAGLLAVAVFAFAVQVSGRVVAGVATAALMVVVGNLAGPRLWLSGAIPAFNFDYF